jgi:hypothetical protein
MTYALLQASRYWWPTSLDINASMLCTTIRADALWCQLLSACSWWPLTVTFSGLQLFNRVCTGPVCRNACCSLSCLRHLLLLLCLEVQGACKCVEAAACNLVCWQVLVGFGQYWCLLQRALWVLQVIASVQFIYLRLLYTGTGVYTAQYSLV